MPGKNQWIIHLCDVSMQLNADKSSGFAGEVVSLGINIHADLADICECFLPDMGIYICSNGRKPYTIDNQTGKIPKFVADRN